MRLIFANERKKVRESGGRTEEGQREREAEEEEEAERKQSQMVDEGSRSEQKMRTRT